MLFPDIITFCSLCLECTFPRSPPHPITTPAPEASKHPCPWAEAAAQASLGGAVRVPTASLRRSVSSITCCGLELTWGTLRLPHRSVSSASDLRALGLAGWVLRKHIQGM